MNLSVEEPATTGRDSDFSPPPALAQLAPLAQLAAAAIKERPLLALVSALTFGYVLGRLVRR